MRFKREFRLAFIGRCTTLIYQIVHELMNPLPTLPVTIPQRLDAS